MNDPAGGESISAASLFGIIYPMYATTSLRDAYRKFRAKDSSFLYAFGQQAFFVFVMGDALGKVSYSISERFDKGSLADEI